MNLQKLTFILYFILSCIRADAAPPFVTYAGQVASEGQPYNGTGQFKFAFVNADANVSYWSQDGTSTAGSEPSGFVSVQVNGGYYSVLLGNTAISGMAAIDPAIFKTYADVHLRVWFSDGVAAFEEMTPHRPFASVPYALNAGVADGSISSAKLESTILTHLKPEVLGPPKVVRSLVDFQKKITLESGATGKYLTYQWRKNGSVLPGETNATLVISEANATHDGNYTVSVSNAFGSVESAQITLEANKHNVPSAANLEMIWVEPGTFTMGSPLTETGRRENETEHNVTLSQGFYLGKYEVTQAQYELVMRGNTDGLSATPSQFSGNPNHPVENVSWDDVQIFLSRLNASEQVAGRLPIGWSYSLPTEPQWEYACRAGTTTAYSWGNDINATRANYSDSGLSQTRDVGYYAANPWGFFDMHGNVLEWCADYWIDLYSAGRVIRGGYFGSLDTRSAGRGSVFPFWNIEGIIGFRLAFKQVQPDTASPELVLSGGEEVSHLVGQPWVEPGVAAHDVRDGDLSARVSVSGLVDVNTTGLYVLTYTVFDSAGNSATANREVRVTIPPPTAPFYIVPSADYLEMIWVPEGNFTMGSPLTEIGRQEDETEHNVTLTQGFYLGKYEVTQAQYRNVMTGNDYGLNPNPSEFGGSSNLPVERVSWNDVQIFLSRLNHTEQKAGRLPIGWSYALPTESQWEYACRAQAVDGTLFSYYRTYGITWSELTENDANWDHGNDQNRTVEVGQYPANYWGFFDMHGNVWEWCADWNGTYPTGNPVIDPTGPETGIYKIARGGGWQNTSEWLRSAQRGAGFPSFIGNSVGFRLALRKD